MHRRDFLHPRRLARAAAELLDAAEQLRSLALPDAPPAGEMALLRFSRQAMATSFEVLLPFDAEGATEAADGALDEIDRLEDQLTVYRDDSEVSRLNRSAARQAVPVAENLFELFQLADTISRETDGAFDITTGAMSKAWGFFRRCARVPSADERRALLRRVGMDKVVLNEAERSVRFLCEGLEINLGSIGKGYALDRAAAHLRDYNQRSALLHGGHSSILAVGSEPGGDRGWPVDIRHPWDAERRLALVWLRNRGLGTSSATFQHLEHDGRKLGHIIDPRTGWPADGIASATAVAPTAAQADALATAFFILGVEKTRDYCAAHPDVGAILLPSGTDARPVVIGLSRDEVAPCAGASAT
jgi:thiamine biosynthesis lipoprotein